MWQLTFSTVGGADGDFALKYFHGEASSGSWSRHVKTTGAALRDRSRERGGDGVASI